VTSNHKVFALCNETSIRFKLWHSLSELHGANPDWGASPDGCTIHLDCLIAIIRVSDARVLAIYGH
jgi:hypothetical protein